MSQLRPWVYLGGAAHDAVSGVPVLLREGRKLPGALQEQIRALLGPACTLEEARHLLQAGAALHGDLDEVCTTHLHAHNVIAS